jgi:hypothetical protein
MVARESEQPPLTLWTAVVLNPVARLYFLRVLAAAPAQSVSAGAIWPPLIAHLLTVNRLKVSGELVGRALRGEIYGAFARISFCSKSFITSMRGTRAEGQREAPNQLRGLSKQGCCCAAT